MSAPELPLHHDAEPSDVASVPYSLTPQHSISPLPIFDLGIDAQRMLVTNHEEGVGTIRTERFRMNDGSTYHARTYEPERPAYGTPVTFTTPWCTDLPGYNDRVGHKLAFHNIRTIAVGPEQSGVVRAVKQLGKASLAHDAKVHHLILDHLEETGRIATNHIINIGYSRGSMVGFGLQAYAREHGRHMSYNDYVDPCLEHSVDARSVRWGKLPRYLGKEIRALAGALAHESPEELCRLLPSVTLAPGFWINQLSTGKALFAGEAGSFIDHLPTDSRTNVLLCDNSLFNHASAWRERLASFPNVTIQHQEGYHLSGADSHVVQGTIGRVLLAQHMIEQDLAG